MDASTIRKSSQACDHCHKRRIKCQYESGVGKCLNCYRLSQNCTFHRVPQKRGPHKRRKNDLLLNYFNKTGGVNVNEFGNGDSSFMLVDPVSVSASASVNVSNEVVVAPECNNGTVLQFNEYLSLYYQEIHGTLDLFPVDDMDTFHSRILDGATHWRLRLIFHSIMETYFNDYESEQVKDASNLWYQLCSVDRDHDSHLQGQLPLQGSPSDDILFILCHLLLYLMIPTLRTRIIGHCIGVYWDTHGHIQDSMIRGRLEMSIRLFDILNHEFNGGVPLMFNHRHDVSGTGTGTGTRVGEMVKLLLRDNGPNTPGKLNRVWYEYEDIMRMKDILARTIQDDGGHSIYSYVHIINRLCDLIHGMSQILIHIDNDKYSDLLAQIVRNNRQQTQTHLGGGGGGERYKYEFGLKMIIYKMMDLLEVIKDIPSFLINMVVLYPGNINKPATSTPAGNAMINDIDMVVTQLSTSMNELVQITTLTYKLGGNRPYRRGSGHSVSTTTSTSSSEQDMAGMDIDLNRRIMFDHHGGDSSSSGNSNSNHTGDKKGSNSIDSNDPGRRLHVLSEQLTGI